jgi:hypothetical protein
LDWLLLWLVYFSVICWFGLLEAVNLIRLGDGGVMVVESAHGKVICGGDQLRMHCDCWYDGLFSAVFVVMVMIVVMKLVLIKNIEDAMKCGKFCNEDVVVAQKITV